MVESVKIEKETIYINQETGEVYDLHADAMKAYNEGVEIQIAYRYRHNEEEWSAWQVGPYWYH